MVKAKKLRRDKESGLLLIDRPEDIPDFATDEEEITFWDTHALSEKFWKGARHLSLEEILSEATTASADRFKPE